MTGIKDLLGEAREVVRKKFGPISERASEALEEPSVWVSFGAHSLDRICRGITPGGLPIGPRQGRVVHIAGEWSTGKSLLLDHLFVNIQHLGGIALCSETEGSRDSYFAKAIGLDLEKVEIQRPATLEELIDAGLTFHDAVRESKEGAQAPFLWGIDSLDSTEAERSAGKGLTEGGGWHYGGGKSEALAAGLRKVVQRCAHFPTTVVMLNQTRENVGVMFGPKKRTPGGNPPHFYASLEIMLSSSPLGTVRGRYLGSALSPQRRKQLGLPAQAEGGIVGRWVRAKIAKTKLAPTFGRTADFFIHFRKGINPWAGMLPLLVDEGIVQVSEGKGKNFQITRPGYFEKFADEKELITWLAQHPEVLGPPPKDFAHDPA